MSALRGEAAADDGLFHFVFCEEFQMPAYRDDAAGTGAGVGKSPMKEPAGGFGRPLPAMGIYRRLVVLGSAVGGPNGDGRARDRRCDDAGSIV